MDRYHIRSSFGSPRSGLAPLPGPVPPPLPGPVPPPLSRPVLSVLMLSVLALGGCSGPAATTPAGDDPSGPAASAEEIIGRVVDAYSKADGYRDKGVVRLSYRQQREVREDESPLSVAFQRPNQIVLDAYQAIVSCDGKQLRARVRDSATGDLDNQIVVRAAPAKLTLADLYADPVIDDILRGGLGRYPVQLELLLGENPLAGFRGKDAKRRVLEDGKIDQRPYHRLAVTTLEGQFVLWIDRETYVLRRLEFPTEQIEETMRANGDADQVQLVADFVGAELNPSENAEQFSFDVPDDARQVRAFVVPPEPLPTNMYGRRPSRFAFSQLDGKPVSHQDLQGKVAVLVWFTMHPTCRSALQQLDRVRKEIAPSPASLGDKVRFFAVSTEPSAVSNRALTRQLEDWRVDLPLVRDLEACGRDVFAIPGAPTMVVLDAQGNVQIYEVGANPDVAAQLPGLLERIVAGEDLASQQLVSFRTEQQNYQRLLESGGASDIEVLEVPKTPTRPESKPKRLRLTRLWSNNDFKAAGNLLVIDTDSRDPRVLAFDGLQTINELSVDGQLIARHELDLPDRAGATYMRSALNHDGKRFYAVSGLRAPQVHLFDENWKLVFRYPSLAEPHAGIHDVKLADMDGKGDLELYAGFWGPVGIHAVDLQGKRLWSNRAATNVLTLALTPHNEVGWHKLLASSDLGPVIRMNQFGIHDKPIHVGSRAIHHIYSRADGRLPSITSGGPDPKNGPVAEYCGLSYLGPGRMLAIGISDEFSEVWSYALPAGTYETEIQFVQPIDLPDGRGAWVFVGPDGSLHMVGSAGDFHDDFGTGTLVSGLAVFNRPDGLLLLVASPEGLTAWRVSLAE